MRTAGLVGVLLWVWLGLVAVVVGVPLCLGLGLVWWTTRKRDAGQVRRARVFRLIGLGVGALIGVLTVYLALAYLAPIAVVVGYLVGAYYGELGDVGAPARPVRLAIPRPRIMRAYTPRWAMLVAIAAAALILLAPVILAAIPPVTYGPWHPAADEPGFTLPGQTLKWPPVLEWLPLAMVAGGALIVGALMIQHALRLPAGQSAVPESSRRNTVRTITGAVAGVELVALGALALSTSAGVGVPVQVGGVDYLVSRILVWAGLGLAVTGIGIWFSLSTWRRHPSVAGNPPQA